MKRVNLYFASISTIVGGSAAYTHHLMESFKQSGYDVHLCVIQSTPRSRSHYPCFADNDIPYEVLDPDTALRYCEDSDMINLIAAVFWKTASQTLKNVIEQMLLRKCSLVLHAMHELVPELISMLESCETRVICIRKRICEHAKMVNVDTTFIKHPYVRYVGEVPDQYSTNAINISRFDGNKNNGMIVKANAQLKPERKVHIYGAVARWYFKEVMEEMGMTYDPQKSYADHTPEYQGVYDFREAVKISSGYSFAIDISDYTKTGDGGGTQYTFLEAFDAELPLIIHENWYSDGDDITDKVAIPIGSVDDLVSILRAGNPNQYEDKVDAGLEILKQHSPEIIIPRYMEVIGGS